jgi:hypothetical protein
LLFIYLSAPSVHFCYQNILSQLLLILDTSGDIGTFGDMKTEMNFLFQNKNAKSFSSLE